MKSVPSCVLALCLSVTAPYSHLFAQTEPDLTGIPLKRSSENEASPAPVSCETVATAIYESISKDVDRVLPLIEDAITTRNECAPLIVATAIEATGAAKDPELLKQIVMLGIQLSEESATDIAQEAVLVAPDSADLIRVAFVEAFDAIDRVSDKPPVKEGPKSEWEMRTNEAQVSAGNGGAEAMEPAEETLRVPDDVPREVVLPETELLIADASTDDALQETREAPETDVTEEALEAASAPQLVWADDAIDESAMVVGAAIDTDPSITKAPTTLESSSLKSTSIADTRNSPEPEPNEWPQEAIGDAAPVALTGAHVDEIREPYDNRVEPPVGELYFVPTASRATPPSAAIRRVSRELRKDPAIRVITREENRHRPSFNASPVVRSVSMAPTTP